MKALRAVLALGLALSAAFLPVRASESLRVAPLRQRPSGPPFVPGELIVQFHPWADDRTVERAIREAGGREARPSAFGRRFLVSLPDELTVEKAVARFSAMPEVDYAEPNGRVWAFETGPGSFTPNDRFFRFQWNFRMINAERTWGIQKGSTAVAVAVLDTGIAYEDFGPFRKAPDWGGAVFLPGFDFINGDTHPNDDNGHGTHVASTIAEATNNGEGVAGLAFGCSLLPVKVLDETGSGQFFQVAEGVDFAINFSQGGQKPVRVINLSLGGDVASETLRRAVDRAVAAGITVVAAAGNDGTGTVSFPASLPSVIAVGAVDGRKAKAPYSNFGSALDVVAPGGDVRRDDDGDGVADGIAQQTFDPDTAETFGRFDDFGYFLFQGTSQATPHVAALAALLVSQGIPDPAAVKAAIESTAEDLGAPGRDDTFGFGLIRPSVALSGLGLNR